MTTETLGLTNSGKSETTPEAGSLAANLQSKFTKFSAMISGFGK